MRFGRGQGAVSLGELVTLGLKVLGAGLQHGRGRGVGLRALGELAHQIGQVASLGVGRAARRAA